MATTSKITIVAERTPLIHFRVDEQPIPYEIKRGKHGRIYKPTRLRKYQSGVASKALEAYGIGKPLIDNPIGIIARFVRSGNARCDVDNLQKSIQDALTGVVYSDDSQVAFIAATKEFGPDPYAEILVMEVKKLDVQP